MSNRYLREYDIIVVGTGIAGMYAALNIDSDKDVLIISKDKLIISNTNLAQGGIAVTFDKEKFDSHTDDTLKTGYFYNNKENVKMMVSEGSKYINTLVDWGVNFDVDKEGNLLFTKEGGHSSNRIVHFKDTTGREIIKGLSSRIFKSKNITILEDSFAIDLLIDNEEVYGLSLLIENNTTAVFSKNIVIATGGIGELYINTTNSAISTGDGVAIAYRVGAEIDDMEFVQFHPTALNVEGHSHFLISEAVRGEGGILRNEKNEAFMEKYHELKDLAPRSVVSRAILNESYIQENKNIFLDITHLGEEFIKRRFPNIYSECLKRGIDIVNSYIPIIPVQHYIMGGIKTDYYGRTNIKGLYACGEVACTGVHGANRMASNSLLEALVFADHVAVDINNSKNTKISDELINNYKESIILKKKDNNEIRIIKEELQKIMSKYVFIFRNIVDLKNGLEEVKELRNKLPEELFSVEEFELKNILTVAKIIIESAIKRRESLGSHIIEGEK